MRLPVRNHAFPVTGIRYWISAVLVLCAVAVGGAALAQWRDWPLYPTAGAAILAGGAGLILGVLPPGRPRSTGAMFQRRQTEPLWPYLPGSEPAHFTRLQMDAAVADERRGATYTGFAITAIVVGIGMAGVAVSLFAAARSEDLIQGQVDRLAGLVDHTPEPSATPPTEPATETATPESPTETPTSESATPTQRQGREPPRPSPTPVPRSQEQDNIDLEGRWQVTDRVAFGHGSGETYRFDITFEQDGDRVTGKGNGMSFEGRLQEDVLTVLFTRPGGFGIFIWRVQRDGSLSGNWHDFTAQNGGPSTLAPIR